MAKYAWNDPPVGLADVLDDLGGGSGVLSVAAVQALIATALSGWGPSMVYKGDYAPGEYAVDDVVTDAGRLLVCTTAYTAEGSASSVVGATSVALSAGGTTQLPLPPGSAAGDLALVAVDLPTSGGAVAIAGMTPVGSFPGSSWSIYVLSAVLTADQITAGGVAAPIDSSGGYTPSATLTVFRAVGAIDTAHMVGAASGVEPSITLTAPALLLHVAMGNVAPTTAALTDLAQPVTASLHLASGVDYHDVGPTPGLSWAAGSANWPGCAVIPVLTVDVDLSKWAVLSGS